jgi:RNA polymerase sigma-32 factor
MSTYLPVLSGEGGLSRYLKEIRRFPLLEPQEEYMLAKSWREHGDTNAAHRLVTSHLRLVAKIAMGYRGYGLPVSELISEGNVGMMQAVKRFDPERGFRLATYAMWWIRASIQEYILHSWSLVKIGTTAAQKKLFFNLRRSKAQLQVMDDRDLTPEKIKKIATDLQVSEDDVIQMNRRLAAPDHSLNAPVRNDGESDMEWQDWLVDSSESQEVKLAEAQEYERRKAMMDEAMKSLSERERQILIERRLAEPPSTLEDLAIKYNVSRERIRQLEVRAFEKLQKAMRAIAAEQNRVADQRIAAHAALPTPSPSGSDPGV